MFVIFAYYAFLVPSVAKERYVSALKKQTRKKAKVAAAGVSKPGRMDDLPKPTSSHQAEVTIKYPMNRVDDELKEAVGSPISAEMMKIYLPNKSYKTIQVNPDHTASELCINFASKFAVSFPASYLQLTEVTRIGRRRLDNETKILQLKKHWPTIVGDSSAYFFEVGLTNNAPDVVTIAFRQFLYGIAS